MHHASCIVHRASCIVHHASCITHHATRIMQHASGSMQQAACIKQHASGSMHQAACIRQHANMQPCKIAKCTNLAVSLSLIFENCSSRTGTVHIKVIEDELAISLQGVLAAYGFDLRKELKNLNSCCKCTSGRGYFL